MCAGYGECPRFDDREKVEKVLKWNVWSGESEVVQNFQDIPTWPHRTGH